ncbi:DM13 domain-containing protein [Calothrix sp. UHCC 0171]|uniref:DM13 domain-containing protein n=1 Tax=Calothrix sp. UHCC 0171 TaxID=3110245 RepID=UPI002B20AFA5|nr:DM13 domain-containing protein [Calothrix sp. UHCC 0171]MEA5572870.1 DM13 domain-containing protein [Calothrix sp. UHCC 0171]
MKLKSLLMLSLTSLVIVSCAKEVHSTERNIAVKPQENPVVQLAKSPQPNTIKVGNFVSGEHKTQGIAIITKKSGKSFLELDKSFKTSNSGPDLVVILHRSGNVIGSTKPPSYSLKKGDYIVLGRLQKFSGSQTYAIPNNINLADYKSAAIWCRKFNATFGAAKLSNS